MPMMMFAIVFGLSMDYEVFLLSRVKEEYDRTGDANELVADGLAATARVITAAAAIMVVVFGSVHVRGRPHHQAVRPRPGRRGVPRRHGRPHAAGARHDGAARRQELVDPEVARPHPARSADLTDSASRDAIATAVEELGLMVDVLVNNAGFSTTGPVHRSDVEREIAMIRTDVEAVAALCSTFLPGMVERASGAVLNVASTAAFQPLPGQAGYGASKAFVLSYSQAVRTELRGTGVTVTVLCPGPVRTEFAEAAGFTESDAESALPGFMWIDAADVAREAIDGLDGDRTIVIPGTANKVAAVSGHLVPRSLLLPLLAKQHPALRD
jgi:short-subunit dehydrogenase